MAFLLTTNRADLLEPALAARPGRVDLALHMPLPDDAGRLGLIRLYGQGLELQLADPDAVVRRTAGVTASFIKELMRKAALIAAVEAEGTGAPTVTRRPPRRSARRAAGGRERDDPRAPRWRRHLVATRERVAHRRRGRAGHRSAWPGVGWSGAGPLLALGRHAGSVRPRAVRRRAARGALRRRAVGSGDRGSALAADAPRDAGELRRAWTRSGPGSANAARASRRTSTSRARSRSSANASTTSSIGNDRRSRSRPRTTPGCARRSSTRCRPTSPAGSAS